MPTVTTNGAKAVDLSQPGGWAMALLGSIGAPNNPNTAAGRANINYLEAQAKAEGTSARFNPLATTLPAPGSTDFNSHGVQNYATAQDGIDAMARTLLSGYPNVVAHLKAGSPSLIFDTAGGRADLNRWQTGSSSTVAGTYIRNIESLFYGEKGAADWTSFDLKDAGNAVAKATGVTALEGISASVSAFVSALLNVNTWRRVGLATLGVVMLLLGGVMLARQGAGGLPVPV